MNNSFIASNQELIKAAEDDLTLSNQYLDQFVRQTKERSQSDLEELRNLQLVLQYRLDTQNALRQLNSIQQYYLQLLGIEPTHSLEINLERLDYALGSEDLHQILAMLNQLIDSLLRLLGHQLTQQQLEKKKTFEKNKKNKHFDLLNKALEKQNAFVSKITQVKQALEEIGGTPRPGVIYDYIAALEGPVSRFQIALQHGLIVSAGLFQQKHLKPHLEYQLADTLHRVEQIVHELNPQPKHQHSLFLSPLKNPTLDSLEERAAAKRLGHFFNH